VTHEDRDDGIGGTRNIRNVYDTAFLDRTGRGWLSFDNHVVYDDDGGTNQISYFRQDYRSGRARSRTSRRPGRFRSTYRARRHG